MMQFFSKIRAWTVTHVKKQMVIIVVLALLCGAEVHSIISDVKNTRQEEGRSLQHEDGQLIDSPAITAPEEIEPWMTFAYINFVFKLPDEYLKMKLGISLDRYPNIQIARYIRLTHADTVYFLTSLRRAVGEYRP
jgi:hypothetical protein